MSPVTVAGFILLNPRFPRSISHCVNEIRKSVEGLLGNDELLHVSFSPRALDELGNLASWTPKQLIDYGLHEYVDEVQLKLNELGDAIAETFFMAHYSQA